MLGSMILAVAACSLGPLVQSLQIDEPVPPVEVPEVSAPATTPDAVTEFLGDVMARLYDPRADGLVSLAFVLPIEDPLMGHTANATVAWTEGSEPTVEVEVLDFELPPMMAQMGLTLEQLRMSVAPQAQAAGRDFLDRMLGNAIGDMSKGRVGSMAGVVDGNVVVRFGASSNPMDPFKEHQLHVDDEGMLRKHIVVAGGPMGDQRVENQLEWQPAKGGDLLVTKGMAMVMDTPMGRLEVQKQTFDYLLVGDMLLLIELSTEMKMPGAPTPIVSQLVSALVVNGQPVSTATPAAPETTEPAVGG